MSSKKPELWLPQSSVSKSTGIPLRTIENWVRGSVISVNEFREVDLVEVTRLAIERKDEEINRLKNVEGTGNAQQRLVEAQCRKILAEAQLKELELDTRRGELIDFKEVALDLETAFSSAKAKFSAIPSRLAMQLSGMGGEPRRISDVLTETIDECLQSLSDEFTKIEEIK